MAAYKHSKQVQRAAQVQWAERMAEMHYERPYSDYDYESYLSWKTVAESLRKPHAHTIRQLEAAATYAETHGQPYKAAIYRDGIDMLQAVRQDKLAYCALGYDPAWRPSYQ